MKYSREIKIGLVLIIAIFLLYFGMNFLKGLDIFSPMKTYIGQFESLNQIETSSPVYIRGYKVGQVNKISYDFADSKSFTVSVVINKDIRLPQGTRMMLVSDGLLGGGAVELRLPLLNEVPEGQQFYAAYDTLPTGIEGGLIDKLQGGLIADLNKTINDIDTIVVNLKGQLEGNEVKDILVHVDNITSDLNASSVKLKSIINNDVPPIVADAKATLTDTRETMARLNGFSQKIDSIDVASIVNKVDTTLDNIQKISNVANSKEGTLGLLINDKGLYNKVSRTIESADTLITDIKAHPKRYINISIFGGNKD